MILRRNYSISTTDAEAFRRLIEAAAGIGSLQLLVTEIRDAPQLRQAPDSIPAMIGPALGRKSGVTE